MVPNGRVGDIHERSIKDLGKLWLDAAAAVAWTRRALNTAMANRAMTIRVIASVIDEGLPSGTLPPKATPSMRSPTKPQTNPSRACRRVWVPAELQQPRASARVVADVVSAVLVGDLDARGLGHRLVGGLRLLASGTHSSIESLVRSPPALDLQR